MNFLTMMYQRMRFRWMNKRGIAENERKENHRMLHCRSCSMRGAVAVDKIVRDILEERKYVSVRKRDREDDDEWDDNIAEEF